MAVHEICIDNWHPVRVNQWAGRHWAVKRKLKRTDYVWLEVESRHVPAATGKRRVTLTIILGKRQRGGDPDSYWKLLLDNLVQLGILKDDRKEWCELAPVVFVRGERKATVITLEDVG